MQDFELWNHSFFLFFFSIRCIYLYDIFTFLFLGVKPPETYSYLMVPSEIYRLLENSTVNNKEWKLTYNILIKDLYLYSINNTPSNAIVKAASKISCHTQYTPISSLAQYTKSIAVKNRFEVHIIKFWEEKKNITTLVPFLCNTDPISMEYILFRCKCWN